MLADEPPRMNCDKIGGTARAWQIDAATSPNGSAADIPIIKADNRPDQTRQCSYTTSRPMPDD
jgi:hypothetical protein